MQAQWELRWDEQVGGTGSERCLRDNSDCSKATTAAHAAQGPQVIDLTQMASPRPVSDHKRLDQEVAHQPPRFQSDESQLKRPVHHGWADEHNKEENTTSWKLRGKTAHEKPKAALSFRPASLQKSTGASFSKRLRKLIQSLSDACFNRKPRARKGILITESTTKSPEKRKRREFRVRFRIGKRKTATGLLSRDAIFSARWEMLMVIAMAVELWTFPYRFALVDKDNYTTILVVDALVDSAFLLDMGVFLCTKVPAGTYPRQEEELSTVRDIAAAYFRFVFPYEILPSVLYYVATVVLLFRCEDGLCWGWWAACVPRMVPRARRLAQYFRKMEKNLNVSVRALQGVRFSFIVFLSAHYIGCAFFWLARLQHFKADTWVAELEHRLPTFDRFSASFSTLYTVCLYRGFNALANIGYDIALPQTRSEILFAIVVMAIQVYLSALVLGTILNYLVAKDRLAEAHKKRLDQVAQFADAKSLPSDLREKIFKHLHFQHEKNVQEKATIMVKLPKSLEMKVADAKYRSMIAKCSARGGPLYQCDPLFLNAMLVKLRVLHVMPGEEFVSKFEIPRELYFVLHGTVNVVDDDNRVMRVIRHDVPDMPPICGEVPFFLGVSHANSMRAKADEDVKLLVLDREDSETLCQAYPEEYEAIHENILHSQGLDTDGRELEGVVDSVDGDPSKALLKDNIIKSLRRRAQERFASLIFAASNGDVDTVVLLARQGVNVDERDHDGRTILHMACASGNYKLVEELIELGADKNLKDRWGSTPMQEAITHKQTQIVALLSQHKAVLDAADPAGEMCQAAAVGDVEAVRRFVENGVNASIGDYDKRTPLHVAAAEGQLKVAEYLLGRRADPNPKDRWGGTPLTDAVRGSHLAVASLLRSKGGYLPDGMGAEQVCEAAASGDVQRLRLLHECGEGAEQGDYDGRCPLHLAAAEGRVLAVSYLLSLSANPNCRDQWGGTPLDDALSPSGTLYHLYCAKLIMGWGGRPGRMQDEGRWAERKRLADEIDIEDVRVLIKKLIAAGYDASSANRLSKTQLQVAMDASVRHMPVVQELFGRLDEIKGKLQANAEACEDLADSLRVSVKHIAVGLAKKGGSEGRRRNNMVRTASSGSDKESAIVVHTMKMIESLETAEGLEMFGGDAIDSDEEMALYDEIEMMQQAQERTMEAGLSPERMASKNFLQMALKIVEIGDMFKSLCSFAQAAALACNTSSVLREEPWLSGDDLWEMLEMFGVDNVQPTELEEVMEEGQAFHQLHAAGKPKPVLPREDANRVRKFRKMKQGRRYSTTSSLDQTTVEKEEVEPLRIPVSSLLAGSPRLRRLFSTVSVDAGLCALLGTRLSNHLSETELQRMLPGEMRNHEEGEVLWDSAGGTLNHLFVVASGELSIVSNDPGRRFLIGETLRQGDVFGAHAALCKARKQAAFEVKAVVSSQVLQIPLTQFLRVLGEDEHKCQEVAAFMGEAPEPEVTPSTSSVPSVPKDTCISSVLQRWVTLISNLSKLDAPPCVSELDKRAMKEFFNDIDQLWTNVSLGSNSIFRKQLFLISSLLGEASSQLFHAMFLSKPLPIAIDCNVFWQCCVDFLADELFSDGADPTKTEAAQPSTIGDAVFVNQDHARTGQILDVKDEGEDFDERPSGCLHRILSLLQGSQRLKFFDASSLDLYKDAWLDVARDTENPMPCERIPFLLRRVFLDYDYPITKGHAQEFLDCLGKDRSSKMLYWHELHKVLCDHRLGTNQLVQGPFIGTAVNPTWRMLLWWRILIRLCAIYYLVMVPLRIAFLPFESVVDPMALGSDLVVDIVVTVDLVIRCNTATRTQGATWSTNRLEILKEVHLAAIAACVPLDWFGYLCGATHDEVCWLRVPKMLLIFACRTAHKSTHAPKIDELRKMCSMVALLLHWTSCWWFYLGRAYQDWYPDRHISWTMVESSMAHMTFDREEVFGLDGDAAVWDKYLMSLYWVITTLTANGSVGDLIPQNLVEISFTILLLILNLTVMQAIFGEVSSMIMSADKETVNSRERLELVETFVHGNNLSQDLQREIRSYLHTADTGTAMDQADVLPMLSRSLQLQVASFTSRDHLEGLPLLKGTSDYFRDSLCVLLREASFAPGQWLFYEAEVPSEMFFLTAGDVEECSQNELGEMGTENMLRGRCSVGELAFFFGVRHYFSARAGKNGASCLSLDKSKFTSLMNLFHDESDVISQNALRIMDRVNAARVGSSRGSKMSRGARSDGGMSRASSKKGKDRDGSVGSERSKASALDSEFGEELGGGHKSRKEKISYLKAKRKHESMLAFLRECKLGNLDAVRRSVDQGLQINDVDPATKRSGLHVAACEGHEELVRYLLAKGADVRLKDAKGNTPLNDSVRHRRDATSRLLRKHAPSLGMFLPGNQGGVLLCEAASAGDLDHIKRLLANGISVNDADYDQRTALHLSSCEGHLGVVKLLLERRASVASVDRFGGTPMEDAVRHRQFEVQDLLREAGARLEMGGKDYSTQLCDAAAKGDLEVIQVLAKNGVDVLADDYDGRTALHLAAANERIAVLEFLLQMEPAINLNPLDRFQDTPLGDAIRHERPTATSMLKQAGGLTKDEAEALVSSTQDAASARKKALREPAVQAMTASSMEQTALRWVIERLEPSMTDKTEDMLVVIQTLCTALQELTDELNQSAAPEAAPASLVELSKQASMPALSQEESPIALVPRHPGAPEAPTPGEGGFAELFGGLRKEIWRDIKIKHAEIKERAEQVLELSQNVKRMVLDGLSVFDACQEAPMDCRVWRMASRQYEEQSNRWQTCLKVVSGLCVLARKLMREIVRVENRKARAASHNIKKL